MLAKLSLNYDIDYMELDPSLSDDTVHAEKARMLFDVARRKGYGRRLFRQLVDAGIARCRFTTWTVADFLDSAKPPRVFGRKWYNDQLERGAKPDELGCYVHNGILVYAYRHDVGDALREWKPEKIAETPSLPDGRPHMDAETKAAFEAWREKTRAELEIEEPGMRPPPPLWNRDNPPFAPPEQT